MHLITAVVINLLLLCKSTEEVLQSPDAKDAILDKIYTGYVKDGIEDIYFFNLTKTKLNPNGVSLCFYCVIFMYILIIDCLLLSAYYTTLIHRVYRTHSLLINSVNIRRIFCESG